MDVAASITLLRHGNQLKRTARTGWVQRGIPAAENVAAHSYGVIFASMILAQLIKEPVEMAHVLALATLHDLPEGLTTDIPSPAWRLLPSDIKTDVERGALQQILHDVPFASEWIALWEELHGKETTAAQLVHDADKIDMYLQALIYEEQTGNTHLGEFWQTTHSFYFPQSQAIYDELRRRRQQLHG